MPTVHYISRGKLRENGTAPWELSRSKKDDDIHYFLVNVQARPKRLRKQFSEFEYSREKMDDCLAELKAHKAVDGHTHVKHSENESLAKFCHNVRYAYNNPKGSNLMKLTEDMVSSLNALGFQWNTNIKTLFEERLDDLRAYKADHGDVNVKRSEDESLYTFCQHTKHAYNNPEATHTMKLTQDRVSSLGALGFQWNINTSFEERLDDLRAYKSVHGDVNVKRSKDKSLYGFCQNTKHAYNNPEAGNIIKLTQDRVSSLEALGLDLGFAWQRNYYSKKD